MLDRWRAQPIQDHLQWQQAMHTRLEADRAVVRRYLLPIVKQRYSEILDSFTARFLADLVAKLLHADDLARWADDGGA